MSRLAAVVILALVAACGSRSPAAVEKHATNTNVSEHDRAKTELLLKADGAAFEPRLDVVDLNQEALPTGGIVGLRPGEGLYQLADGVLALMPKPCIRGNACGCEVSREYTYLKKADGSVVVARLTPVVHLREIKVERCGTGCGQPAPPTLRTAARLGVRQVSGIKFVEMTYPYELVVETCDNPIPRP